MHRRHHAVSLMQAADASPTLARLADLARESQARLKALEPLIPMALRTTVTAGPIDGDSWCLLVSNTASAAKLRQLLPSFKVVLTGHGWVVNSIRVKVQANTLSQSTPKGNSRGAR